MTKPLKPKTVEELTKGFEELAKRKGYEEPSKKDFDRNLKKTLKPKGPGPGKK